MNKPSIKRLSIAISLVDKKAPTEFRIWKYGDNPNDYGSTNFTENSAKFLMDEQKKRGNLYSIDYNHMSLRDVGPIDSTKAAGWHRLEVRKDSTGKPELWAVNVEWSDPAKKGLEANVPEWRYFSPAFYQSEDKAEVYSYINTALCINPATFNNTMLASRKADKKVNLTNIRKNSMDPEKQKLMALQDLMAIVADANTSPDTAKALQPAIDALVAELGGQDAVDQMLADMQASTVEASKKEAEAKVEAAKKVEVKVEAKKEDKNVELALKVAELTAKQNKAEVKEIVIANIGTKIPEALKEWALDQSMETVQSYLSKAPLINPAKATQNKVETAVKGDLKKVEAPVNADVEFIKNSFGLGTRKVMCGVSPLAEGQAINGSIRSINVPTPSELKAAKKATKK